MTTDEMKHAAASAALEYLRPGEVLGVGTGTTAAWFITLLAGRRDEVPAAVASSAATAAALRDAGVRVVGLDAALPLGLYVDGADEVDPRLCLIKGGGGAHTREKVLATAAALFVCIVDEGKLVERLGRRPVPLEVTPWATPFVAERLRALGGTGAVRSGLVSDNGNLIVDVAGLDLSDPVAQELELEAIPGVVACGIFARRPADVVLAGGAGGVRTLRTGA